MLETLVVFLTLIIIGVISYSAVWIFVWLVFPKEINWEDDDLK